MARIDQPVLPLTPAEATPIGSLAALVEGPEGGVVFVSGLVTFTFAAGDDWGRRIAAAQLASTEFATVKDVAAAFGVRADTVSRWKKALAVDGIAGLKAGRPGPKRPSKLTDEVLARIRELDREGLTQVAIAAEVGVDATTVRVALGRRKGSAGWETRKAVAGGGSAQVDTGSPAGTTTSAAVGTRDRARTTPPTGNGDSGGAEDADSDTDADADGDAADADHDAVFIVPDAGRSVLPVLPTPAPRINERVMARWGLLDEAQPVFTEGAHLPYAGLLLILPALAVTGLLDVFDDTYGKLKNGFYGLRVVVLTLVFLALLREPRAEGLTRITPHDLGRLLGLDRAPEVKTLRRKLGELATHKRGADLQRGLAAVHAKARPEALGFLLVDGHLRAYFGTRDLPKTHVARLHMAARATAETWVCDVDGDPVMVVIAPPSASLAAELVRLLPDLRQVVGSDRRVTMIFDRGGWSPLTFKKIIDAGFDIITYRKGDFDELPPEEFAEHVWCEPGSGTEYTYMLGETTVIFDLRKHGELELRQIHKRAADGTQVPLVTSRTDLQPAEVCWRLGGRWRQENYFRYARQHFDLDALDTYADTADDGDRLVPNPAKADAKTRVAAARQVLADAKAGVSTAVDAAAAKARHGGKARTVEVDRAAIRAVTTAGTKLAQARADSKAVPGRVRLATIRPQARLLEDERKLITHAIRMACYNAETTLARMLRPYYARAVDEARALIREAMKLSGDLEVRGDTLHVRLDPASAPRRSRALHALCDQLTATETRYPGTDLKIHYSLKTALDPT